MRRPVLFLAFVFGANAVSLGQVPEAPKHLAYLVLMHRAQDGKPEATPRMKHFALPDPRLGAQFKKLGFSVGVAPYTPELTLDFLKQFNLVVVPHPVVPGSVPGFEKMVAARKKLLLEYVQAGGGLLVMRTPGWQFGKDIDAINEWLKPADVKILGEQVVDEEYQVKLESGYKLSWTDNVAKHPVTEGVGGLFYTTYYHMYSDSSSPLRVGKEWTVLIKGKRTTKTLKTVKGGKPPPPAKGTYSSEPPLLAVREYGQGRIAVWPTNASSIWQDGYHILWGKGLIMAGQASGMKGDATRLLKNLFTWLAEPSTGRFGGYIEPKKEKAKKEVGFVKINWDRNRVRGALMPNCYVGLIGAKSSLSSGQGAPEEFIQAAQKAGYDFIGFTEDLKKLTSEKFKRLKTICAENSAGKFKAYPGFAYRDESGNSWATFSDRLRWPEQGWWSQKFPGRLKINNPLSRGCQWPPVILLQSHKNPEKAAFQGNFKVFSLFTYEGGKLVDDSLDTYLRLQKMRYTLSPVAVHLVNRPEEVRTARENGFQTYVRWYDDHVVDALSGHIGKYQGNYVFYRSSFVSEGPRLEDWRILNFATSDLAIPTNDRFRIHLKASSDTGLREVSILNSDAPQPWRRFLPHGKNDFEISIDHFHDQQYIFIVQLMDTRGRRAFGWGAWTGVQENSFPRCSDNINTMPRGKWWGQPKDLQNVRGIENYLVVRNFKYIGLPSWSGVEESARPAIEYYPFLSCRFGTILDCRIFDHYPKTASANPDRNDTPERAVPNQVIAGTVRHTLFTPWQDGPLVALVAGDFEVKKDFELKRAQVMAYNGRKGADCFSAMRKDGTFYAAKLTPGHGAYIDELPEYGFAALFPQPFRGSVGMISLQPGLWVHAFDGGNGYTNLRGLLGRKDPLVKAGERLTYRYLGVNSKLDPSPNTRFITDVVNSLGIRGKTAYKVRPTIGSVEGTRFSLRLKAERYGFSGKVSQASLPLNLPVLIRGLNPRWHAGVWYKGRNTFVIAEWVVNALNQRYTVRRRRAIVDEVRSFPVMDDGQGLLQIDTEVGDKEIFIGNLLICDHPEVALTLVDRRKGKAAFVVHNPTDQPLTCTVRPASGFALLGEFEEEVAVPAGSSVRVSVKP